MGRQHGTGRIYVKYGSYYGRSRTPAGRCPQREAHARTVDAVADVLRQRLVVPGSGLSYRQNYESMQRVNVAPSLGKKRVDAVTPEDVDRLERAMLERGLAPKTVRHVITFLHAFFALAVENSWARSNPVLRAARPRRPRDGDADPDLQFLTLSELDAVIAVIPDLAVDRDALGPVLRLVILAAATSGLRQSELLGLQWKHVDSRAQRIRVLHFLERVRPANGHTGVAQPTKIASRRLARCGAGAER